MHVVMAYPQYSLDEELANFFAKTTANRSACDARAEELVGGKATPVAVQGNCSYSIYAGPCLEYVVQFRLESLRLGMGVTSLATQLYGGWFRPSLLRAKSGTDQKTKSLFTYM